MVTPWLMSRSEDSWTLCMDAFVHASMTLGKAGITRTFTDGGLQDFHKQ